MDSTDLLPFDQKLSQALLQIASSRLDKTYTFQYDVNHLNDGHTSIPSDGDTRILTIGLNSPKTFEYNVKNWKDGETLIETDGNFRIVKVKSWS
jgi:hypothetical protein